MRRSLIAPLRAASVHVLGRVRRDSALFLPPEPPTQEVWRAAHPRGHRRAAPDRARTAPVGQAAARAPALGHRACAPPQGRSGTRGVVRAAPARWFLIAGAASARHRDPAWPKRWCASMPSAGASSRCPTNSSAGGAAPTSVSTRAKPWNCGNSRHRLCPDADAGALRPLALPADGNRRLAPACPAHRPASRRLHASEIYRGSSTPSQSGEIQEIHPARTGSGSSLAVLIANRAARRRHFGLNPMPRPAS